MISLLCSSGFNPGDKLFEMYIFYSIWLVFLEVLKCLFEVPASKEKNTRLDINYFLFNNFIIYLIMQAAYI